MTRRQYTKTLSLFALSILCLALQAQRQEYLTGISALPLDPEAQALPLAKSNVVLTLPFVDDFSYDFKYQDILPNYGEKLAFKFRSALTGGVHKLQTGLYKSSHNRKHKFGIYVKSLFRSNTNQLNYALYPDYWKVGVLNNSINTYYERPYKLAKGKGTLNISFRATALLSDYNYEFFKFESEINNYNLNKTIKFLGKNQIINKLATKFANKGIVV